MDTCHEERQGRGLLGASGRAGPILTNKTRGKLLAAHPEGGSRLAEEPRRTGWEQAASAAQVTAAWGSSGRWPGLGLGADDTAPAFGDGWGSGPSMSGPVQLAPLAPGSPSAVLGAGVGQSPLQQGMKRPVATPGSLAPRGSTTSSGARASLRGPVAVSSPLREALRLSGPGPLCPPFWNVPKPSLNVCFFLETNPGKSGRVGKGGWRATPGGAGRSRDSPPSSCLPQAPPPAWRSRAVCRPVGPWPSVPVTGARMAVPRSPAVEGMGWGQAAWLGRTRVRGSLDKALQAPGHPSLGKTRGGGGRGVAPEHLCRGAHRDAGFGRGHRSRQDTTATPGTTGLDAVLLDTQSTQYRPRQKVLEGSGGVGCGGSPLVPAPGVATGPSIAKSGRA